MNWNPFSSNFEVGDVIRLNNISKINEIIKNNNEDISKNTIEIKNLDQIAKIENTNNENNNNLSYATTDKINIYENKNLELQSENELLNKLINGTWTVFKKYPIPDHNTKMIYEIVNELTDSNEATDFQEIHDNQNKDYLQPAHWNKFINHKYTVTCNDDGIYNLFDIKTKINKVIKITQNECPKKSQGGKSKKTKKSKKSNKKTRKTKKSHKSKSNKK